MAVFTKAELRDSKKYTVNDSIEKPIVVSISDRFGLKFLDSIPEIKNVKMLDTNFAFLTTTLAKLDPTLYKPKHFVTWQQDIPAEIGGAFVDYIEWRSVDYAGIVTDATNLVSNNANIVNRINAKGDQHRADVYTYEIGYDVRWVELEKLKQVQLQESIQQIYQDGIMMGWDFAIQGAAYTGAGASGEGLFNSTKVKVNTITNTSTTGHGFEGLTDAFVTSVINGILADFLEQSNMNEGIVPDTLLVPTFVAKDLAARSSVQYNANLLEFIRDHNLMKGMNEGYKLTIKMRPGLDTLGTGGHGRIVAYKKDKEFVKIYIPKQVGLYKTEPNAERFAYTSLFVGQYSDVVLPYNTDSGKFGAVGYYDFTA